MKPSPELFKLIKSLSRSEKRFFKLQSKLQTGSKNYMKIFDTIIEQIESKGDYDEEALVKKYKDHRFIHHLPSEKNHLYKLLLKSLRQFHADNSVSGILKQELKNIEILYKKRLFKQCNRFIDKAKKMARQHEKFYYLLELISWEKLMLQEAYEAGQFNKKLDPLIEEEQSITRKLRNLASYQILYTNLHFAFKSGGFAREEEEKETIERIRENPLILDERKALSTRAALQCHYIRGSCHTTFLEKEKMYLEFKKVRDIFEENPELKKDMPLRYIHTLGSLNNYYVETQNAEASFRILEELQSLPEKEGFNTVNQQVKIFVLSSVGKMLIYDKTGQHHRINDIIEDIEKGMWELNDKINKEQKILIYFNIAYLYFGAGQHKEALRWLNMILNDNEKYLRRDLYSYARLFNLVLHYELDNRSLLQYIIKSTYRYLRKRKRDLEAETVILDHIKRLARVNNRNELRGLFQNLKDRLDGLFEDNREKVILEYFDFQSWLDSKLQDISFSEAVKRRVAREKEKLIEVVE